MGCLKDICIHSETSTSDAANTDGVISPLVSCEEIEFRRGKAQPRLNRESAWAAGGALC